MTPTQARATAKAKRSDARRPYALSVADVAMHLTRQRENPCSDPRFVAAYLTTELGKEPRP